MTDSKDPATAWAKLDPNHLTAALASDAEFTKGRIAFGTAGLRSAMSAGPLNMNDVTVFQTTQGIASYLLSCKGKGSIGGELSVVIGWDHRSNVDLDLGSLKFAKIIKKAFEHVGIKVLMFSRFVATPLVPFAVKTLKASLGVMVTASHNPAADNGYKVSEQSDR